MSKILCRAIISPSCPIQITPYRHPLRYSWSPASPAIRLPRYSPGYRFARSWKWPASCRRFPSWNHVYKTTFAISYYSTCKTIMKTSLFRTGTPRFIVIDPPPSLSDRIADTEIESLRHSVTAPYMKGQPDRKGNISFDFYGRKRCWKDPHIMWIASVK